MSAPDDAEFVSAALAEIRLTDEQVMLAVELLQPYCPTAAEAERMEEARRSALEALGLNPDAPTDPDLIRRMVNE